MGYAGKTLIVPCSEGGWNTNPNFDTLPPTMMEDVTNINYHLGGRHTRGGTKKVYSSPISSSPRVMGVYQYVKKNGNSFIMSATADGKIYSNYTTLLKAGLTANTVFTFETFDDKVYICNGEDMPQVWDGSTVATYDIGTPALTVPTACTATLFTGIYGTPTSKTTYVTVGDHSYKITFVNVYGESQGGATSNVVTVTASHFVDLTNIPTGPSGVTSRKIYRTLAGDDDTTYQYLDTIYDNTTTTYRDDTPDTSLGADMLTANSVPADWVAGNYPKRLIKHGKGSSERLWAIGCKINNTRIYVSDNGTDNFGDDVVITLNIETGDGQGIVDAVEFGDKLMCFGKTKSYIIDDQDLVIDNWGYSDAIWVGGVGALRLVVETPNDLIAMSEDGDIYSVKVAESYGDYTSGSIVRPTFLHKWIQENVDLTMINDFHMVYDPELKALRVFIVRKGQTEVDTCLVFFTERGTTDGWTKHNNLTNPSGFNASCSTVVREAPGQYKVYTGDYDGYVWKLEQDHFNDNGLYYYAGFMTVPMIVDTPRGTKNFHTGWVVIRPQGTETIHVNIFIDKQILIEYAYLITSDGDYLVTSSGDKFLVATDKTATGEGMWTIVADNTKDIQNLNYRLGINGLRIQFEIFNDAVDESMFINELLVDHRPLAARFT
jgi:hypothetical protein